jgi:hypothetical protein
MKDHTGKTYGRLKVLRQNGRIGKAIAWEVECECGKIKTLSAKNLARSKSCGCLMEEKRHIGLSKRTKHGLSSRDRSKTHEDYNIWQAMRDRCKNPNNKHYKNYGGRGIEVCQRWDDFKKFTEDMGKRPKGYSIDRIDNNKNYCPENCKWASIAEQNRNKRDNIILTFNGKTMCAKDWATELGLSSGQVITWRLNKGWTLEEALTKGNSNAST